MWHVFAQLLKLVLAVGDRKPDADAVRESKQRYWLESIRDDDPRRVRPEREHLPDLFLQ